MKRTLIGCACMAAASVSLAGNLNLSTHVVNPDSNTGFSVYVSHWDNESDLASFTLYYDIGNGEQVLECDIEQTCSFDLHPTESVTVSQVTQDAYMVTNGASEPLNLSPSNVLTVSTSSTQSFVVPQVVHQMLQTEIDRDASRAHHELDRLATRQVGWQVRNSSDVQQLSIAPMTRLPVSLNLSQESVGEQVRDRLDAVTGQSWQQGQWRLSVMGSFGVGTMDGVDSHWYSAGFDAWYQQGPFVRATQQFSDQDARSVAGYQLSSWQNQTLLTAVGWRHQSRMMGINWDGSVGLESSRTRSVGMVGDGNQWQAITDVPDVSGAFLSLGVGDRSAQESWRVGLEHFRDDTQLVLTWGF